MDTPPHLRISKLGFAAPPRDPLLAVPPRRADSVRRTMHVDVGARMSWGAALPLVGGARDLRTGSTGDEPVVVAEANVQAGFDPDRQLVEVETHPPAPWVAQLLGVRAGGGFRKRLAQVVPTAEQASLLRQVLDDMPAAMLISGYAFMRLARRQGLEPSALTPPNMLDHMVDLCSGWRAGGIAADSIGSGHGVPLQDTPAAPDLERGPGVDPWAWHDTGVLARDHMRRRRFIDVHAGDSDGSYAVWAMFRDTVGEEDGAESVLHEYVVESVVADGRIAAIEAHPRVLPFPECPGAAGHVSELVGTAVTDLAATVPVALTHLSSCTHLNDLLRALGGLADLIGLVTPTVSAG